MISLNDAQLKTVMAAAANLPMEKRDVFLQRVGAVLERNGRLTDADVTDAAHAAMRELVAADGPINAQAAVLFKTAPQVPPQPPRRPRQSA